VNCNASSTKGNFHLKKKRAINGHSVPVYVAFNLVLLFEIRLFLDVILYDYFTLLFIRISIDLTCIAAYYLAF